MTAGLALAFAAGMVATLNPCGFAMLPAYLSYFMGLSDDSKSTPAALRSGFAVGAVVSVGFMLVFGLAGIAITVGFRGLTNWIPWVALVIGVGVTILGIAMVGGYQLSVGLPKASRAGSGKGWMRVFTFGVSYAIASLSCTLPVFLSVVATQLTQQSLVGGIAIFLAYALGMSMVLIAITVVMALGKQSLVQWLRGSARYINRVSGVILVASGLFIIWFWGTEIAFGASELGSSPLFQFVENLSQLSTNFVANNTLLLAGGLGGLLLVAALVAFSRRRQPAAETDDDGVDQTRDLIDVGGRES